MYRQLEQLPNNGQLNPSVVIITGIYIYISIFTTKVPHNMRTTIQGSKVNMQCQAIPRTLSQIKLQFWSCQTINLSTIILGVPHLTTRFQFLFILYCAHHIGSSRSPSLSTLYHAHLNRCVPTPLLATGAYSLTVTIVSSHSDIWQVHREEIFY